MDNGLNAVAVLRTHLDELERTLGFVEGLLVAQDLQNEYKQMAAVTRPSQLTKAVQRQLERVRGYLQEVEDVLP